MTFLKNFLRWGEEKERIHNNDSRTNFSPQIGEVFHGKVGVNIGFESDGKSEFMRPVLILSKVGSLCLVAPLTSKLKENVFHYTLKSVKFKNVDNSVVMISHIRTVDKKRLIKLVDGTQRVSRGEMKDIQKEMKKLYFPSL